MKSITSLIALALSGCACVTRADDPSSAPGLLDFIAANRSRQFSEVPHEVLAFYYTWYGRPDRQGRWIHWGGDDAATHDIPESTHYPARGAYDSQDPETIAAHIAEAKENGVTGFIATWWGQGGYEDRSFQLLLDTADTNSFKTTVYWETAPGKGQEQIDRAVNDLAYLLDSYGERPSFLKVDGRPVIFVYGRVMGEVPLASWPAIITGARAKAGDFLLIADGYTESFSRLFDGVHTYNNCGEVAGKSQQTLRDWSAKHYEQAVSLARAQGRISCVTVIPGYDDTKIRKPGLSAARQDGQTYRVLWEEALMAEPDWVLITSWNEWHEGSEIEPSWEDGDQYLKLTAGYARRFLAGKPARATKNQLPELDAANRNLLLTLLKNQTIGVLPEFGDTAFWLLDAGLAVKELSWADVVDPTRFNPNKLPLVLHAGGEHYTGTVKDADDVVFALQRYLAQGGFLVSIPNKPFPFYYDDALDQPRAVANQVGLPVQGGWEQPPAGERLRFQFDTNALPGLPPEVSFPTSGDLRWRPARRSLVDRDDSYLSLASLVNERGQVYGDGIAYIEYRTPPLQGGKAMCVWMRMADAVGDDRLLMSVFQFLGDKLMKEH